MVWDTPAGEMTTTLMTKVKFTMPELHNNRIIEWDAHVCDSLGAYDMIVGRDVLTDLKIDILFSSQEVVWDCHTMPFKDIDEPMRSSYWIQDLGAVDSAATRVKDILDAKYEAADLDEIARESEHLNEAEKEQLSALLVKYASLFDGTLGHWKDAELEIELNEDAKPYHARAYPIPKVHYETLKLEVDRLVKLGVLKKVNRSEWAAPTFIVPKKDGTIRFISDFRELNKRIKRKPYPLPKIQDLLIRLEGFQYATSLDLNMGYYHIELNPNSK